MVWTAALLSAAGAWAKDLRLEDCPAAVQQAVLANSRDGRVDEIELSPDGSAYEVEINLPRLRERQLRVAADGTILQTVEDIDLGETPEPVRRTVEAEMTNGGRLEELEKKISEKVTTFLVEIDLPDDRDLYLEIADNGSILQRLVRD
ncbi:MAG: hypothetical protein WEC73_00010 [Chthoniobacterales bacterium]